MGHTCVALHLSANADYIYFVCARYAQISKDGFNVVSGRNERQQGYVFTTFLASGHYTDGCL